VKGLTGHAQAIVPVRKCRDRNANPGKGEVGPLPAAHDLDPGASSAHLFGDDGRRAREAAGMTLAGLGAMVPSDGSKVENRIGTAQLVPEIRGRMR
jgi:hypothetical protein